MRREDDVRSVIQGVAEKVTLQALADRGFRRVKVLDMATIERIVADAVARAFAQSAPPQPIPPARSVTSLSFQEEDGRSRALESKIELLERRLAKLGQALAESEEARAERPVEDEGVASHYRSVQGLRDSEPNLDRKRALLEVVFKENLVLQRR
jgi:predicted Zn-dependent protease